MSSINELVEEAHETAKDHGWWDNEPEFGTLIALCTSELSEALQEYRKGMGTTTTYYHFNSGSPAPQGIPTELADVCIRIFDLCGHYGINLQNAIDEKMEYNKTREWRHGGKVV